MKTDVSELIRLTQDLEGYAEAVERAEYRAINKVTDKALTRSKRAISEIVRLNVGYIAARMDKQYARPGKLVATITGSDQPRSLASYGAKAALAPAPKAKGNPGLGIPAGRKQRGVRVGVKAGSGFPVIPNAFLAKLKSGGVGVFTKRPDGGLKFRHGPSLDQSFGLVVVDIEEPVAAELEQAFDEQLAYELKGLLL